MNGKIRTWTISVFLAVLLLNMVMVPVVSAEKISPRTVEEWEKEHTVIVEHTTEYYFEKGVLQIKETYSGPDLKARFNTDQLEKTCSYQMKPEAVEKMGYIEGQHYKTTEITSEVFTTENDPPVTLKVYDYPQWIYEKIGDMHYLQLDEPINIAWENNDMDTVKSEMLDEGWWDITAENVYYIYDNNEWRAGDGVASDPLRILGGWHVRLWEMADGDVVGAAHHDSAVPHHADGFENAEEHIAAFYDQLEDDMWHVFEDYYALDNYVEDPYNNGMCTSIYYW